MSKIENKPVLNNPCKEDLILGKVNQNKSSKQTRGKNIHRLQVTMNNYEVV